MQEIPIDAIENQSFQVTLKGNIKYDMELMYNRLYNYFTLTIKLDDEYILTSRKLSFGRNIIDGYDYLDLGSTLGLYKVAEADEYTYENLGVELKLLYEE